MVTHLMPPPVQTNNKRRHLRVACNCPIELTGLARAINARLVDVSRSGVRVLVPETDLGLRRLSPAGMIGGQVLRVLGAEFGARLHAERLGSLLTKRLRPIRIGRRERDSGEVEIGCMLPQILSDAEAAMLGLVPSDLSSGDTDGRDPPAARAPRVESGPVAPVVDVAVPTPADEPAVRRSTAGADVEAPVGARSPEREVDVWAAHPVSPTPTAGRRAPINWSKRVDWRAYVQPIGARSVRPFVARAESVSAEGVRLRVADRSLLNVGGGVDVASTMTALHDVYGSEVGLRLVDGTTHRWTGPARIDMVEVGQAEPHPVTIWMTYARTLRTAEVRALDLGGWDQ